MESHDLNSGTLLILDAAFCFQSSSISKAHSTQDIFPSTMAGPTILDALQLDAITPAPTEVLPQNLPLEEHVESPIHTPTAEVEEGEGSNVATSRSKFRITMILIACFLSVFVAALDDTIVATAVPTITAELHSPSG